MASIPAAMETIRTGTSLDFTFGILTFCGIWMPPSYAGTRKSVLYGFFSFFMVTGTLLAYLVTESMDIYLNLGDMEKTIETSLLTITIFSASLKAIKIITERKRIQRLMEKFDEPNFSRVSKTNSKHLLRVMMISNISGKILIGSALGTVLLWGAFPLFDKADKLDLPLRAWFPWDRTVLSTFIMLYVYQVITLAILASLNASQDVLICSIVILICGQFDVLYSEISALGTYNKQSGKQNDEIDRANDKLGGRVSQDGDAKLQLRWCILHQKDLIDCIKEVESLFSGVIFVQFLGSCIVVCVTAFQLSVTPFSLEFLSNLFYMCTVLVELFLYCYPGNELMLKSTLLSEAAYLTPWYEQELAFRKMLITVMERSKRPITVTAGRIMPLTLSTLTSILRSSYSYYAVLRTMHDQ